MPTALELLADEASTCTRCPLATQGRTQVVFGVGDPHADLMFIGEAPGAEEDKQGLPFVGRSGKLLDKLLLEEVGVTRDRVYIANILKSRPPGNRDPLPDEVAACTPWLERQIELIAPRVIVTLGRFAAQYLLASTEPMGRLRGRVHPWRHGAVVVPTWHPSYLLRGSGEAMAQMRADLIRAKAVLSEAGIVVRRAEVGGGAHVTVHARTTGADETRKLAGALAELARPGDVLLLAGDLGAGKTAFAQGFARGLGVVDAVTSPTFTLARQYRGRLVLHHLDVYRLEQMEEVFDIGLPELLDEGAVTLIEWGDAIAPALPADYLEIRLTYDDGDSDDLRSLALRPVGAAWSARNRAVLTALEPWLAGGAAC